MAIKAALKDQELTGLDIVSDGELRRDNDIDYLLDPHPRASSIPHRAKTDYYDYYDAEVHPAAARARRLAGLGLAGDFEFTREQTDQPVKFSFTGPFSLSRRIRNGAYADASDLVLALARLLNAEARALAAAGARPAADRRAVPRRLSRSRSSWRSRRSTSSPTASTSTWALHVCYGNRHARPLWEGHYDFLFPGGTRRARSTSSCWSSPARATDDLRLFKQYSRDRG